MKSVLNIQGHCLSLSFWIDTIIEWQKEKGKKITISLAACKDVQDAILADPIRSAEINVINLTYWWYLSDGKLNAPKGGTGVPGRYVWAKETTPFQIYRQVKEYHLMFPNKAIIHSIKANTRTDNCLLNGRRFDSYKHVAIP